MLSFEILKLRVDQVSTASGCSVEESKEDSKGFCAMHLGRLSSPCI